jgi:predicted Zn-dependent protease
MIKSHKIRLYTVKNSDTWERIATDCGQQPSEAKTLALINAFNPSTPPTSGTIIKNICVEGK